MSHSLCAYDDQTKRPETPATGRDRERHRRAEHPVGEPTRVHTAHQRDEADESRGVPSTSMGTVEKTGEIP